MASDPDGQGLFIELIPQGWMDGMVGGVETAAGTHEHIVSEDDLAGIYKNTVVIGIKVIADFDIPAKAAENVGFHIGVNAHFAQKLTNQLFPALHIRGTGVVVLVAKVGALQMGFFPAGEGGIIQKARLAFLQLGHTMASRSHSSVQLTM